LLCIETVEMAPPEKAAVEQRLAAIGYRFLTRFDLYSDVYVR
jgi:hypothetical protein